MELRARSLGTLSALGSRETPGHQCECVDSGGLVQLADHSCVWMKHALATFVLRSSSSEIGRNTYTGSRIQSQGSTWMHDVTLILGSFDQQSTRTSRDGGCSPSDESSLA